jgi:hypothetical protein
VKLRRRVPAPARGLWGLTVVGLGLALAVLGPQPAALSPANVLDRIGVRPTDRVLEVAGSEANAGWLFVVTLISPAGQVRVVVLPRIAPIPNRLRIDTPPGATYGAALPTWRAQRLLAELPAGTHYVDLNPEVH